MIKTRGAACSSASSGTSAPVDQPTLLNTGMTRDGLFLIENGEIAGPVQNFRWNMSPIVGFNNVTAIGRACRCTRASRTTGRHGAGPGGQDGRLLHDVGVAGGLSEALRREARRVLAAHRTSHDSHIAHRTSRIAHRQDSAMSHTRRDFIKTVGAAGSSSPAAISSAISSRRRRRGRVLDSKFKGLSDIALAEAKTLGCSYADIRFTRATNSGVNANGGNRDFEDLGGFGGGGGRGGRGGGRGGGGGRRRPRRRRRRRPAAARPASACA